MGFIAGTRVPSVAQKVSFLFPSSMERKVLCVCVKYVCVSRKTMGVADQDGHRGRESYQMPQVIDFKPKYLVRGIPTDYRRYRAIPVGLGHQFPSLWRVLPTKSSRSYLRYLILAPFPGTRQTPPGQASHFILTSFYFNMIGSREAGFFRWFMPLFLDLLLGPGAVPAPSQPPPDIF